MRSIPPRPLSDREAEIIAFLLTASDLPDRDVLRKQASAATVIAVCDCSAECASVDFSIDHSKAPQAATALPRPVALASTGDLEEVDRDQPLAAFGPGGNGRVAWRETRDVAGAIWAILWAESGWLSGVEIAEAGDFWTPSVFPPPRVFEAPRIGDLPDVSQ
jgi:hypothetical protein